MPINIPSGLPATEILKEEKIFIMDEVRSTSQNIRPLNILIFNLMPEKRKDRVTTTTSFRKYTTSSKCYVFKYGDT